MAILAMGATAVGAFFTAKRSQLGLLVVVTALVLRTESTPEQLLEALALLVGEKRKAGEVKS